MASTFSQTLRLELIGDGDQSGIWGQTTNTNLGTLLEQAITGVVSITMTDANYTLTNFNGVSDEARNMVLVVGGTNAAVRDIIAPLVEKLYVVKNSTVGGFAVNIKGSTGSAVAVPNGATVWVYCDGTNFNAVGTETVGNFEVNGNLTVTGNTNAVAATYTGNVVALNYSTAGNVSATGNASAANFIGAGLTLTSINASNISAGTISNARTTASSANGASTLVTRDASGNFAANVITATTQTVTTNDNTLATTAFVRSIIPAGVILLWSGSSASIPSGWLLCNGLNGTPDLRDRFVVGAGSSYAVGATGGAASITLSTAQLPSHTHSISASGTTSGQSAGHTHTYSGTTSGQSQTHTHTAAVNDPGHAHQYNYGPGPGPDGAAFSGNRGFFDATASATTGITVSNGNASVDHTHTYSGTTSGVSGDHTHTVTVTGTSGSAGSGSAIDIRPPYYALCYIMKS